MTQTLWALVITFNMGLTQETYLPLTVYGGTTQAECEAKAAVYRAGYGDIIKSATCREFGPPKITP